MSRPNFPGMNPYLEQPDIWPEVHYGLISGLMRMLNPVLNPKYRAAVDKRVYTDTILVGLPDTTIIQQSAEPVQTPTSTATQGTALLSQPEQVALPMMTEITEYFLEIREISNQNVITVIEVLSPKNKRPGKGREQYLKKRQTVLGSQTHFVEIDLLRKGEVMPTMGGKPARYQVLVSRVASRPLADRYPFNLQDPIPRFPLPLQPSDGEPVIDLGDLLRQAEREAALDLVIDYSKPPSPSLEPTDQVWLESL
ncbi:MAG: DUF4058 family protein [Spirulina sp. SIO3F2]|nr:DUF4058 family protein [Spirulina sp. SIO3F2]